MAKAIDEDVREMADVDATTAGRQVSTPPKPVEQIDEATELLVLDTVDTDERLLELEMLLVLGAKAV